MAGCRLETVILGLIGGEMLITPPFLWLDYTLPVCCQARLLSCNHCELRAEAVTLEKTKHCRNHTISWQAVTLWPSLAHSKGLYFTLTEHLCMLTAHWPPHMQARAHLTETRKCCVTFSSFPPTSVMFITSCFFTPASLHCSGLLASQWQCVPCWNIRTHIHTCGAHTEWSLTTALFSCLTFKTGAASRQVLHRPPLLLLT